MSPKRSPRWTSCDAQALAPTREAQDRYNDELQDDLAGTVWNTGGCRSWYMDEHGVNRTLWSGMTWQYWLATRKFKPSEYTFFGSRARHANTRCRGSSRCRHPRGSVGS